MIAYYYEFAKLSFPARRDFAKGSTIPFKEPVYAGQALKTSRQSAINNWQWFSERSEDPAQPDNSLEILAYFHQS